MLTPQAIEFAMEEGDEELWEVLISLSIHNPSEIIVMITNDLDISPYSQCLTRYIEQS